MTCSGILAWEKSKVQERPFYQMTYSTSYFGDFQLWCISSNERGKTIHGPLIQLMNGNGKQNRSRRRRGRIVVSRCPIGLI